MTPDERKRRWRLVLGGEADTGQQLIANGRLTDIMRRVAAFGLTLGEIVEDIGGGTKSGRPASISNNTQPNAQMSERLSAGLPRACSGLI